MPCAAKERQLRLGTRQYRRRPLRIAAKVFAVACASCVLAGCIGFGFASAGSEAPADDSGSLGVRATSPSPAATQDELLLSVDDSPLREHAVLAAPASRDISKGVAALEAEAEAARQAAEEARLKDQPRIDAAESARAAHQAAAAAEGSSGALSALGDVDWSVGKDAFIEEWTSRIDGYLAGSPLAGQGVTFATAAWEHGVDPRWSPAISNTESSKGAICFKPYNAWGWGSSAWGSWEDAINAHVQGLAEGYGYSLTYAAAGKYCPPNTQHWFTSTLGQMALI